MNKHEQRAASLVRANEVRNGRLRVKRELKGGEITVFEALSSEFSAKVAVYDLLISQHYFGHMRSLAVLDDAKVSEKRLVGSLTDREISTIAALCALPVKQLGKAQR